MGNILENTVECTCEEFVAEIAGKRRKPYLDALKSTFKTIVLGKSTLAVDFSDNAADIALRTHSLLAGIRTLASKARIRFISGRPRTRGRLLPGQLTLDLRTADGSVYRL